MPTHLVGLDLSNSLRVMGDFVVEDDDVSVGDVESGWGMSLLHFLAVPFGEGGHLS